MWSLFNPNRNYMTNHDVIKGNAYINILREDTSK